MIRLLDGPNFSGRSAWLEARAAELPWPQSGILQGSGESALTGLATSVGEELSLSTTATVSPDRISDCENIDFLSTLELGPLLERPLHFLSGGELVRCALASAIAQGVGELLIDVALEQLDAHWRSLLLTKFSGGNWRVGLTVADNRLSSAERALGGEIVRFVPPAQKDATVPELNAACFDDLLQKRFCTTHLAHLSFRYGRRLPFIFKDLQLTLETGRLYVLAGPNGAGKTSMLRLLSGTVLPTGGWIEFQGRRFDARKRERHVALSFQNPDFQFSRRTIRDELLDGVRAENAHVDVETLLLAAGISPSLLDTSPFDAPFAFKKRLANLLAIVAGKPVIAFDEPTLGQDHVYRAEFAKLAESLVRRGRTILLISHDDDLLTALSNKTLLRVGQGTVTLDAASEAWPGTHSPVPNA